MLLLKHVLPQNSRRVDYIADGYKKETLPFSHTHYELWEQKRGESGCGAWLIICIIYEGVLRATTSKLTTLKQNVKATHKTD